MKNFLTSLIMLTLILSLLAVLSLFLSLSIPPSVGNEETMELVTIPVGATMGKVTDLLKEKGIIRSRMLFSAVARWRGMDIRIKAGEYQFSNRMLPHTVLDKLTRGEQIKYSITVPEGLTLQRIAGLYEQMELANKEEFVQLATDPAFAASLNIDQENLEGYLYPDTYKFIRNLGEKSIIRRMVRRFNELYNGQFEAREAALNLSRKEVVTLASLIEKETARSSEKPLISAVFHNRLKKKMRLRCDPTVIYGLETFTGRLTKRDLRTHTPFNTYLNYGLPPTPIANPGIDSIRAALYPADVDYLYFVSKNDGTHFFSSTLAEHNQAVRKYQRSVRGAKSPKE
jgi:UPF0755 protein